MPSWFRRFLTGSSRPTDAKIDLSVLGVVECKECHKCLRHRFVLRLMVHLEQDHGFTDLQAQDVSVYMLELLLQQKHKQEKTDGETTPNNSCNLSCSHAQHGGAL